MPASNSSRHLYVLLICTGLFGQESQPVALPEPRTDGGRPLMQTLRDRKSSREFRSEKLPPQVLSNLLWAAFGINRPESGRRTAPSASNRQEIDIYVATGEGLYRYHAGKHVLDPVLAEDIRGATGGQGFVREAPVQLVYVADFSRMGERTTEDKIFYAAADTGFISQNVYLYCASEGLATVVRASTSRATLAATMKLRPEQRIILAQSVGYPK